MNTSAQADRSSWLVRAAASALLFSLGANACVPEGSEADDAIGGPTRANAGGATSDRGGNGGRSGSTAGGQAGSSGAAGNVGGTAGAAPSTGGAAGTAGANASAGAAGAGPSAGSGGVGGKPGSTGGASGNGSPGGTGGTGSSGASGTGPSGGSGQAAAGSNGGVAGTGGSGPADKPLYPYCACLAHDYQENEVILEVNGHPATAHRHQGILYAKGDADHSFKPGHWVAAGGFPDRCAQRFAEGDPTTGWQPPPPPAASTRTFEDGQVACQSAAQGIIYARKLPDGRMFLCRSYADNPGLDVCTFVPQYWARDVCSFSDSDAALFDTYDPRLYAPCK